MSTQRLRPAPEPIIEPQLQPGPEPQELLVEYPGAPKIVVNLPEESLWEQLASSARPPFNAGDDARPANLAAAGRWAEQAPGSSAPLIVAATGLAMVAYLWSFIVL